MLLVQSFLKGAPGKSALSLNVFFFLIQKGLIIYVA